MEILRIHKLNEVFFQIECDDAGIKMELREHFSFFAQNYKFHPDYKARRWDGRLYLYDIRFSRLHIGLFWDFFHFCDERGYRIEFVESRHTDSYYGSLKETITPNEVDQEDIRILDSIPFVYNELRDYQMNSVVQAIAHRRQIIVIPTGGGKSGAIYYLSLWHIQKHQSPVLIVVPTTGLVAQMTKDFHVYAKGSLPRDFVHQIYSGQEKENINHRESPVVVSTWQSLAAIDQTRNRRGGNGGGFSLKSFLQPYGMIIIDECVGGETEIKTPTGLKKIKDFKPGDVLISYNESSGKFEEDSVIKLHTNLSKSSGYPMLRIILEDDSILEITGNHKVLTKRGWILAGELEETDELISNSGWQD